MYFDLITMFTQVMVLCYHSRVEIKQLSNAGFVGHFVTDRENMKFDMQNVNDFLYVVFNGIQLAVRISFFLRGEGQKIIPLWSDPIYDTETLDSLEQFMVIINLFTLIYSSIKVLSILKMFESIGSQVVLVFASL